MRYGALEAGGTKMVCAVGDEEGNVLEQYSIPTRTPEETIPEIIQYFLQKDIQALGIGAFGPVDVRMGSTTYGQILDTPKLDWRHYNLLDSIQKDIQIPIGFDTDVNASCLGEMTFGSAKGLDSVIYITIGTGIGVGISVNGSLLHGMLHPEAGHILITKYPGDSYPSKCLYHDSCFEGLAAGPSIEDRWGAKAFDLTEHKEVWEMEAYYIAQGLMSYILTLSPQKIILGGGVMHQKQLFPLIHQKVIENLNGYINTKELMKIEDYIVPSTLDGNQGIMGCFQLAKMAYERSQRVQ